MFAFFIALSYILGSIPFSFILTKLFEKVDIRKNGSGNVGATNVYRVNKKLSAVVLILDAAKSALPILLCSKLLECSRSELYFLGLTSVIGHVFPVWLRFKGGKGVATALGVMLVMSHTMVITFMAVFSTTFLLTRYVSISSLVAMAAAAVVCYSYDDITSFASFIFTFFLVLYRHRENMFRIVRGKETKL